MRALQVLEPGNFGSICVGEVPEPIVPHGGIVIRVAYAGLSFPDVLLARGLYQIQPPAPFTIGVEASGVVHQTSPGCGFAVGDRVATFVDPGVGTCAEFVPAPRETVCRLPSGLTFAQGAGLLMNYHSAHFALLRRGRLRSGETVLIHGAAGGIGTAATQIAKAYGARVIAVVSSKDKANVAVEAGADDVVLADSNISDEVARITQHAGVQLVLDSVGGDRVDPSLRSLSPEGRLVVVGFAGGTIPTIAANRVLFRNVDIVGAAWGPFVGQHPEITAAIADDLEELVSAGWVRPIVKSIHSIEDGGVALEEIAERRALGKVVVRVHEGD